MNSSSFSNRLYRSEKDRVLAGVAGGLGRYFKIDPLLIRIAFLFLTFAGGGGIILYLVCWLLIPSESSPTDDPQETIKANAEYITQEVRQAWNAPNKGSAAYWLILLGIFFLLVNFGLLSLHILSKLWPIILIFIGFQLFTRSRD